jgi:NADH-quinone oxidoreductase subunit A
MNPTAIPDTAAEASSLVPFLVYVLSVVAVLAGTLLLAWLLGSRTRHREATDQPFESGVLPVGSAADLRLSVQFYLVAMFFVIFDLETILIFAWAVAFYELGWRGYVGAAAFIVVLLAALVYEVRIRVLNWGARQRGPGSGRAET